MPRRRVAAKREVLPDPKFGNTQLAKFMNHVMYDTCTAWLKPTVPSLITVSKPVLKFFNLRRLNRGS